jgi:hypothetical protein
MCFLQVEYWQLFLSHDGPVPLFYFLLSCPFSFYLSLLFQFFSPLPLLCPFLLVLSHPILFSSPPPPIGPRTLSFPFPILLFPFTFLSFHLFSFPSLFSFCFPVLHTSLPSFISLFPHTSFQQKDYERSDKLTYRCHMLHLTSTGQKLSVIWLWLCEQNVK